MGSLIEGKVLGNAEGERRRHAVQLTSARGNLQFAGCRVADFAALVGDIPSLSWA